MKLVELLNENLKVMRVYLPMEQGEEEMFIETTNVSQEELERRSIQTMSGPEAAKYLQHAKNVAFQRNREDGMEEENGKVEQIIAQATEAANRASAVYLTEGDWGDQSLWFIQ